MSRTINLEYLEFLEYNLQNTYLFLFKFESENELVVRPVNDTESRILKPVENGGYIDLYREVGEIKNMTSFYMNGTHYTRKDSKCVYDWVSNVCKFKLLNGRKFNIKQLNTFGTGRTGFRGCCRSFKFEINKSLQFDAESFELTELIREMKNHSDKFDGNRSWIFGKNDLFTEVTDKKYVILKEDEFIVIGFNRLDDTSYLPHYDRRDISLRQKCKEYGHRIDEIGISPFEKCIFYSFEPNDLFKFDRRWRRLNRDKLEFEEHDPFSRHSEKVVCRIEFEEV